MYICHIYIYIHIRGIFICLYLVYVSFPINYSHIHNSFLNPCLLIPNPESSTGLLLFTMFSLYYGSYIPASCYDSRCHSDHYVQNNL